MSRPRPPITDPEVLAARFHAKVQRTDTCWIWTGALNQYGYGKLRNGEQDITAHRIAHELFIGPIPEGLYVDHLCHNWDASCAGGDTCQHRRCVNPAHLEAVTHRVNLLRGKTIVAAAARKTHCPKGHPYDEDNTILGGDGKRRCRECRRATELRRRRGGTRRHVPNPVMRMIHENFPGEDYAAVLDRAIRALVQESAGQKPTA